MGERVEESDLDEVFSDMIQMFGVSFGPREKDAQQNLMLRVLETPFFSRVCDIVADAAIQEVFHNEKSKEWYFKPYQDLQVEFQQYERKVIVDKEGHDLQIRNMERHIREKEQELHQLKQEFEEANNVIERYDLEVAMMDEQKKVMMEQRAEEQQLYARMEADMGNTFEHACSMLTIIQVLMNVAGKISDGVEFQGLISHLRSLREHCQYIMDPYMALRGKVRRTNEDYLVRKVKDACRNE